MIFSGKKWKQRLCARSVAAFVAAAAFGALVATGTEASSAPQIVGIYNLPPGRYDLARELGLNAVVGWPEPEYFRAADSRRLKLLVNIGPGHFPDSAAWRRAVETYRTETSLFAWIPYDEPDINRKPVEEVAATYRELKRLDPKRPVLITVYNPARYAEFAPYCDILAVVPYVVTKLAPLTKEDYDFVAGSVRHAKKFAGKKPVWVVIQSFAGKPVWPRPPSPDELKRMVNAARTAGASGFLFYAYTSSEPYPPHGKHFELAQDTSLMEAIRESARRLNR